MPPTFWEQHHWAIILGAMTLIGLSAVLVRWRRRPKLVAMTPPEVLARQALEALDKQPEDDRLVAEVSQVVRRYARAAFGLQGEELTTEELVQALERHAPANPDVAMDMGNFLRECDVRKFAPAPPAPAPGMVARALGLVVKIHSCQPPPLVLAQPAPPPPTQPPALPPTQPPVLPLTQPTSSPPTPALTRQTAR